MTVLLDTGPTVAALDRSDTHHHSCAELLRSLAGQLAIPSTVLVEVCWLLEDRPDIEASFLDSVASGEVELITVINDDLGRAAELVRAYADFPLGFVDASVIAVAERLKLSTVATIDRRHFTVVRPSHVPALNLLP